VVTSDLPCAHCGYNLRGLNRNGCCPECGRSVDESIEPTEPVWYSSAQVRWARLVLVGVALLVIGSVMGLGVVLMMSFSEEFGGTLPRANFIGAKVAAVPLLQRALGYGPGEWGHTGVCGGLMVCAGLVLVTTPPTLRQWQDPLLSWRPWARWAPLALFGGFFGLTLGCEGVHPSDPQVRKFMLAGIIGVELPASMLLYWLLYDLARRLALPSAARAMLLSIPAIAVLMIGAALMVMFGRTLRFDRNDFPLQLTVATYGAVSVCAAAVSLGALTQICSTLLPIALRRGWGVPGDSRDETTTIDSPA
jgi:hypothetical protein